MLTKRLGNLNGHVSEHRGLDMFVVLYGHERRIAFRSFVRGIPD